MSGSSKEVQLTLPTRLVEEFEHMAQETEDKSRDDFIHRALSKFVEEKKKDKIREMMRSGYVEMRNINLDMATEAFLAEEEAESTRERLVSGV